MEDIDKLILEGVRVLSRRGVQGKGGERLMMGDLVYDEKNNEPGILLAVKPPIEIGKHMEDKVAEKSMLANIPIQTFPEANTCTVMTLSKDPTTGENMLRVRYTASSHLKRIEEVREEVQTLTDLECHCQNECLLECDPECSLWKYRKNF